jgi:CRP-like cAMP-binding protein
VELATLKEGEFFGEMALLSGKPRSAFVEAVEADTQVLEISAGVLARLSRKFPRVSSALWRFYRQRLLSNVMGCSVLFKPFELGERQQLIRRFQALEVGPQTVVVAEEQMSEGLFVILIGHMEVIKNGKKIAILKEGELFGEISLLTKAPATASVVAVERSSLLKLPAHAFNALISTHPQILELLSKLMEERIHSMAEEFSLESLGWENADFGVFI